MRFLLLAMLLFSTPVFAQSPAPEDFIRMIQVIEGQRNQAQAQHVHSEAQRMKLAEENAKLKAEIEELKKGK